MPELLYGARALADWIVAGGKPERAPFAHAARLRWHAYWFELNWRTAAASVATRAPPLDPVFIVGPWRSGTTALHELLAAATAWPTPQTWQCFHPSTCFLVKAAPRDSTIARPMDAGTISSRSPQEDEFATLLLGEDSVYRGFIDPRRLLECATRLWHAADPGAPSGLQRWETFIRGVAPQDARQRLLLKSPNHTFRMPALQHRFPHAQFIWMGRRSREVLASNLRMWRAMMERYALWSCPKQALEEFLQQALNACLSALTRCLEELSPAQLLWVDFDDLCAAPERVLRGVLDFVQWDTAAAEREARLRRALQQTPVHAGSRLLAPAGTLADELDALMVTARERFGRSVAQRSPSR